MYGYHTRNNVGEFRNLIRRLNSRKTHKGDYTSASIVRINLVVYVKIKRMFKFKLSNLSLEIIRITYVYDQRDKIRLADSLIYEFLMLPKEDFLVSGLEAFGTVVSPCLGIKGFRGRDLRVTGIAANSTYSL